MTSEQSSAETVHLLLGFAQYYPTPDNTIRVFADEERAERICEELNNEPYRELRERYDWLPKHDSEIYITASYEVDHDTE